MAQGFSCYKAIRFIVCLFLSVTSLYFLAGNDATLFKGPKAPKVQNKFGRVKGINDTVNSSTITSQKPANVTGVESKSLSSNQTIKTILLWTSWFGLHDWPNLNDWIRNLPFLTSTYDENKQCLLTTDRVYLNDSDAVLFHGSDINLNDLPDPKLRKPFAEQKFIFYMLEGPYFSNLDGRWGRVSQIGFNWIMSYSSKADVYNPYGQLFPAVGPTKDKVDDRIQQFVESFPYRVADAVWIVSHCSAPSKRDQIVEKLKDYGISVDIKGKCPGYTTPDNEWSQPGGYEAFFQRYRFYLSFENSLCDDYVTEKAYNGFNASQHFGLIPIVYGGANYSAVFPSGSYIDVFNFTSIEKLAEFMKTLKRKDDDSVTRQLRGFFNWQLEFEVHDKKDATHTAAWSKLCTSLWKPSTDEIQQPKIVTDIRSTFGKCRDLPRELLP